MEPTTLTGVELAWAVPDAIDTPPLFAVTSHSASKKKGVSKAESALQEEEGERPEPEYPYGWKLWLTYASTLLTMFLVRATTSSLPSL